MSSGHNHNRLHRSSQIGAILAIACAIHCALMPLLITALPVLGGQFLGSHAFEISMIGTGVAFGLYSTIRAYPAHRRKLPLQLVALGTAMIVVGLFFAPEVIEPVLIPVGAVLLGAAQVLNIRYVRQCEDCAH